MSCRGSRGRRGFTLFELLIAIAALGLLLGIMLPALGRARGSARQVKDQSQIRGIHQALVVFSQANDGEYPTPSRIDRRGVTLGIDPEDRDAMREMDTSRHIFSILLQYKSFTPQLLVSPSEVGVIEIFDAYQYSSPVGSANPRDALWDPAFMAVGSDEVLDRDRTRAGFGYMSYAHAPPFGRRQSSHWTENFDPAMAIVGNRGPAYDAVGRGGNIKWELAKEEHNPPLFTNRVGESSVTLMIHGDDDRWNGNIAYNDNRVTFQLNPAPADDVFMFRGIADAMERAQPDNLFVNEDDFERTPRASSETVIVGERVAEQNNYLRSYSDQGTSISVRNRRVSIGAFYD